MLGGLVSKQSNAGFQFRNPVVQSTLTSKSSWRSQKLPHQFVVTRQGLQTCASVDPEFLTEVSTGTSPVVTLLQFLAEGAAAIGFFWSIIPQIDYSGSRRNQRLQQNDQDDPSDRDFDNFKWVLMSFISCVPLVNFTAWLLPGILDSTIKEEYRSNYNSYYLYSIAYFIPYIFFIPGVDDKPLFFAVSMLLLGAFHLQVERLSITEPGFLQQELPFLIPKLKPFSAPLKNLQTEVLAFTSAIKIARDAADTENDMKASRMFDENDKKIWEQQLKSRNDDDDKKV